MITVKKVLKEIGCPYLELVQGNGYLYFVYDDVANNIYETESVYVSRLNHMDFERWVDAGRIFVDDCKKKLAERPARYENMSSIYLNLRRGE